MVKDYTWVRYIQKRTTKMNKNFLVTLTGPTGSGKSWTGLSIGELVDPEFNIDRVVFKGKDLMRLINSGDLKSGSVIVWDEAGIDLSSRNWQSLTNKMLNFLLQTFRHKNFVLIFTVPFHDFLDVSSRKLFHADFETTGINRQKKTVSIKPKLLQYNPSMKKWYRKYLRIKGNGKGMSTIRSWRVPKPSKELIGAYESKKSEFTSTLNKEIEYSLSNLDKVKPEEGEKILNKPLTPIQKEIIKQWEAGVFIQKEIGKKLNRLPQQIHQGVKYMRSKGYKVENYKPEETFSLDRAEIPRQLLKSMKKRGLTMTQT